MTSFSPQLLAVIVTVLLNWGAAPLLDSSDVTNDSRGQLSGTTGMPLMTQIAAPGRRGAPPTADPGRDRNATGDRSVSDSAQRRGTNTRYWLPA